VKKFLGGFALTELRPDREAVQHARGVVARVLSSPGREYAVYLDGSGPTELTLDLPEGQYSGEWIDVLSGEVVRSENFKHSGGRKVLGSPKFTEGIALRLLSK
jgi:hypothetical protein